MSSDPESIKRTIKALREKEVKLLQELENTQKSIADAEKAFQYHTAMKTASKQLETTKPARGNASGFFIPLIYPTPTLPFHIREYF